MDRVHEQRFLAKTIEEYVAPQSRHNVRQRHFELVAERMNSVRRRKAEEMLARWGQYRAQAQREDLRISQWRRDTQDRRASRRRSRLAGGRPLTVSDFRGYPQEPPHEPKTPSWKAQPVPHSPHSPSSSRSGRVRSLQLEEQLHLSKYISKLEKSEERLVSNLIQKQSRISTSKSKPTRILTALREQKLENVRRQLEEESRVKDQTHQDNYLSYKRMREQILQQKSAEEALHATAVVERKDCLHESFMNRYSRSHAGGSGSGSASRPGGATGGAATAAAAAGRTSPRRSFHSKGTRSTT